MNLKLFFSFSAMALCLQTARAQEKAMCVQRTDGTTSLTRVADISKISFLSIADPGKSMVVSTKSSGNVAISFEALPKITMSGDNLVVTTATEESPVTVEIEDVAEIRFGQPTSVKGVGGSLPVECVIRDGAALFRGIPEGADIHVYALDGQAMPVPPRQGGELLLDRNALGTGVYVVRIGASVTKITL